MTSFFGNTAIFTVEANRERLGKSLFMLKYVKIPDIVTLCSLLVAIMSIYFSLEGKYNLALGLLPLSAFLDCLDGFTARLIQRQGNFGKELDLLVDLVAFGVTLTVFWLATSQRTIIDILVVMIYLTANALRLAALSIRPVDEPNKGVPDDVNAVAFSIAYFLGLRQLFPVMFVIGAILMLLPIRVPRIRLQLEYGKITIKID